ncbi:MAG: PTS sugar transporter subunit IIB, partial [Erysipelotrichaceae bacterium]
MKNIVLLCSAGMSTSMLVTKMKAAADAEGFACTIAAYGVNEASTVVPKSDIVLLGPQIRFNLGRLQKEFPDAIVEAIDMASYGRMDGAAV